MCTFSAFPLSLLSPPPCLGQAGDTGKTLLGMSATAPQQLQIRADNLFYLWRAGRGMGLWLVKGRLLGASSGGLCSAVVQLLDGDAGPWGHGVSLSLPQDHPSLLSPEHPSSFFPSLRPYQSSLPGTLTFFPFLSGSLPASSLGPSQPFLLQSIPACS